jgi:formaldehyde-activating enzyme involved in methanogenesis
MSKKICKIASKIAAEWQDQIDGGLADNLTPQNFDQQSLINGLIVELEHTNKEAHEILKNDPEAIKTALSIAMDHLFEDEKYYDKLSMMEDGEPPIL